VFHRYTRVTLANTYGANSFNELKAVMNLAESEREGGISPNGIPFKEMSDYGNLLSRTGFNLTSLNLSKFDLVFRDFSQICDFLLSVGENNFLINRRKFKSRETFISASAIYQSMFSNKQTSIYL
jgi:NADH dehydrogenase [ubiquinone] 1 alpha subcomplex assembly factor 5